MMRILVKIGLVAALVGGCALVQEVDGYLAGDGMARDVPQHRWWSGFGPVLSHEEFPADCSLCHQGGDWHQLVEDFAFDHGAETGHELSGAHARATCLRCHNDRGPVEVFQAKGCAGCHVDVHRGRLGDGCTDCHGEHSWDAATMLGGAHLDRLHRRAGFELLGAHALASCDRCHPAIGRGEVGGEPKACEGCHGADLAGANAPDHQTLGWTFRCDRCHQPFTWQEAEL